MATNKELRSALLNLLGVSKQRLSQLVKKTKTQYGPMNTEEATYVIAHQQGIDLTEYLAGDMVDRVRGLVRAGAATPAPARKRDAKRAPSTVQIAVNLADKFGKLDTLLSSTNARDAVKMAELYPIYYLLENSIRLVIRRILEKKYGKDWWNTKAPKDVINKVNDRKAKEDKSPWHGKRGQHEIFYSDFRDLRAIIDRHWLDFEDLFSKRHLIMGKLEELEHPRNVMAHHNPVSAKDLKRIEVYFDDLMELIAKRKDLIQ